MEPMIDQDISTTTLRTYFEIDGPTMPDRIRIDQADLMVPTHVTLPRCGQTFLYGTRNVQHIFGHIMNKTMERGHEICMVDVRVDIGHWVNRKQDFETLESLKFFKFPDRARASLMDDLSQRWKILQARHGLAQDNFPREPSPHMHLLDEIVKQPPYDQLNVIVYPLMTSIGWTQGATLLNPSAVIGIESISRFPIEVTLGCESH